MYEGNMNFHVFVFMQRIHGNCRYASIMNWGLHVCVNTRV